MTSPLVTHVGGCHCGAVKYKVVALETVTVFDCNCSICSKKQNYHFIVPLANFTLLQGEENLSQYTFGSHQAKHKFCKTCGVQSFYHPRSNPDGVGIMPHCIESGTIKHIEWKKFNGQKWEESMASYPEIKTFSKASNGD